MSKSKKTVNDHIECTKPNLEKVKQKMLNTAKCAAEQPTNAIVSNNLNRLKTKYPKVAESIAERLEAIAA